MTWECAPERDSQNHPEAQHVRLRYVEKPAYEEVVPGKGLCDRLTATGKNVVTVDFEAWGNWWRGLVGFNVLAIDGEKIVPAGGFGSSAVTGRPGPHPLARYFE